ncbi:MAG: hypothetical protein ABIA75_08875 [Candidatus Neomarinimicrobiota bacterium]
MKQTNFTGIHRFLLIILTGILFFGCQPEKPVGLPLTAAETVIAGLVTSHGPEQQERIATGVEQLRRLWQSKDGSDELFGDFCRENFVSDPDELLQSFQRLEAALESVNGHLTQLSRELQWNLDVDTGPLQPIDYLLGSLSLDSHVNSDLFATKIAFWVLLNYPLYSLEECLAQGADWSRQKWAEVRLAQRFANRVPAAVSQGIHEAYTNADNYINGYNIYMGNLLTASGEHLFPKDLRLVTHWGLRDQLKADFGQADGLTRQRLIYDVMQKIIYQDIPQIVIDNPTVDWNVAANTISGAATDNSPEPDTRYYYLRNYFLAEKNADPYYSQYPNFVDRSFNLDREVPEAKIREMFNTLLSSEELAATARLIGQRLGRDFEPFDIWYNGLRNSDRPDQAVLDRLVAERYPDAAAFQEELPDFLTFMGFDRATALFLQSKIDVDPSRGIGHAAGAGRRNDNAHLRTRVPAGGMDYRGYNIATHELGHNVEQVFSISRIDHTLLEGVPNTAFTEAFAYVFQDRDLAYLGFAETNEQQQYYSALHGLWTVCEIAAVALVDMDVWRWMYAHPDCTPAELKTAVIEIARGIWNKYYYPILGHRDTPILAVYSHMIDNGLYLPNYPLGQIIEFQIQEYIAGKNLGREMERMCTIGNITPDQWMQQAVGQAISVEPLLAKTRQALAILK